MRAQLDPSNFDACPDFNRWLDEQHNDEAGVLNIFGFQPRPSQVLFSLSPDTYQAAFADYLEQREAALKQTVFDDFPSPIAYYFYRFEYGYESELQRLHLLRDTWEAVVDLLHATAVAECRVRQVPLADPIAFSHILSDSVNQRILNFERIVNHANGLGLALSVSRIAASTTLAAMRELNRTRNAFSHSAAQSELQAQTWIGECYQDVLGVLDDLQGLADIRILRYVGHVDGNTIRCELFKGHSSTKRFHNVALTADHVRDSQRYFRPGQVLISCEHWLSGLRPLVHYREDATGNTTKLCVFRKTLGDAPNRRIEYEVVGEANRREEDRLLFKPELDELRQLFGLPPD